MVTKIGIENDEHTSVSYNSKNYTSKKVDKIKALLTIIRFNVMYHKVASALAYSN